MERRFNDRSQDRLVGIVMVLALGAIPAFSRAPRAVAIDRRRLLRGGDHGVITGTGVEPRARRPDEVDLCAR
jgi:hypothetical protein